jgi:hypothetical protein
MTIENARRMMGEGPGYLTPGTVEGLRAIAKGKHRAAIANASWLNGHEGYGRIFYRAQACRALAYAAAARFVYANAERIHASR